MFGSCRGLDGGKNQEISVLNGKEGNIGQVTELGQKESIQ